MAGRGGPRTAAQMAALKKAQEASARKRRGTGRAKPGGSSLDKKIAAARKNPKKVLAERAEMQAFKKRLASHGSERQRTADGSKKARSLKRELRRTMSIASNEAPKSDGYHGYYDPRVQKVYAKLNKEQDRNLARGTRTYGSKRMKARVAGKTVRKKKQ